MNHYLATIETRPPQLLEKSYKTIHVPTFTAIMKFEYDFWTRAGHRAFVQNVPAIDGTHVSYCTVFTEVNVAKWANTRWSDRQKSRWTDRGGVAAAEVGGTNHRWGWSVFYADKTNWLL